MGTGFCWLTDLSPLSLRQGLQEKEKALESRRGSLPPHPPCLRDREVEAGAREVEERPPMNLRGEEMPSESGAGRLGAFGDPHLRKCPCWRSETSK